MSPNSVENRLTQVEKQLAALLTATGWNTGSDNWIDSITGSAKDDPDFAEIVKLGKVIRDADKTVNEIATPPG